MIKNYYQMLGLLPSATKEEIKKAYWEYAKNFHPDKQQGSKFFEERFKEITEAHEILTDDDKRAQYDRSLHQQSERSNSYETQEKEQYKYPRTPEIRYDGVYLWYNGAWHEELRFFRTGKVRKQMGLERDNLGEIFTEAFEVKGEELTITWKSSHFPDVRRYPKIRYPRFGTYYGKIDFDKILLIKEDYIVEHPPFEGRIYRPSYTDGGCILNSV